MPGYGPRGSGPETHDTEEKRLRETGGVWAKEADRAAVDEACKRVGHQARRRSRRRDVMRKVSSALQPAAFHLGWNHGAGAGQHVFHLHVHVLPRWSRGRGIQQLGEGDAGADLAEVAAAVRDRLSTASTPRGTSGRAT